MIVSDKWISDVFDLLYDVQCIGLLEDVVDRVGTTSDGQSKAELVDWMMSMGTTAGTLLNANNSPCSDGFLLN